MANFGFFTGRVLAEWSVENGPDRKMVLQEPFTYTNAKGDVWAVPQPWSVDGASIPQFAWSFISPYIGDYRRASVVHDYFCDVKTRPWRDTHRMFHEASRCGGTDAITAGIMFGAVYAFG